MCERDYLNKNCLLPLYTLHYWEMHMHHRQNHKLFFIHTLWWRAIHILSKHFFSFTCRMLLLKSHFKKKVFSWYIVIYAGKGPGNSNSDIFSSPELKAQVSFSDHLSSVVCLSVRPSVCLSVCKLFTFSFSSPEPLGQFQPNLAQSILGWRGFKFVQMKGHALPKGEIIGN